MNQDAWINKVAYLTGCSRKQVIEALKKISKIPEVQKKVRHYNKKS